MSGRLAGRRVLVTGAASGIGRATARLFAREGARLALLDRDGAGLSATAGETAGLPITLDLTEETAVAAAMTEVEAALGGLDGVVNCAGLASRGRVEETTLAEWQRVIGINLTATFLLCRAAVPLLRRAEQATIVTLASASALLPAGAAASYAAAKAGVIMFTKSLARELAPAIRANVVCPGAVETPMLRAGGGGPPVDAYAMRRIGQPEEIAAAILFLTSAESGFVTGSALAVDGGRSFH